VGQEADRSLAPGFHELPLILANTRRIDDGDGREAPLGHGYGRRFDPGDVARHRDARRRRFQRGSMHRDRAPEIWRGDHAASSQHRQLGEWPQASREIDGIHRELTLAAERALWR
jgi:hypothetical protein